VPDVEAGSADVRITVDSEGSISGRIAVRGSDAPVSDFEIVVREAHPESPAYGRPVAEQSFRERADGRFRIDGISAGSYVLQVSAKGFATAFSRELRVGEARETGGLHVRMGPGAALTGRVVAGCSGDPLAGARVDLREDGWGDRDFAAVLGFASGLSRASLVTDADGRFAAEGLTAGTYEVRLSHADFQPVTVGGLELGEEGVRDLGRLELHRGSTITGTVRALDGAPAALVDVFLRTASPDAPFATSVTTDEEGRYRIRCSAGIYDLCAVRPPREPGLQGHLGTRISVGEGDERVQDLQLDTL
jgi:hypothetical protein